VSEQLLPTPRRSSTRGRVAAGVVGGVVGLAAAATAAGFAAERALRRRQQRDAAEDPFRDEPFGELPASEYRTVTTPDGIPLHVEITGPKHARTTVVFVHGFCLDIGTFHFQRKLLSTMDDVRTVSYDQPGHGRSGRLHKGEYTIEMLAWALYRVIEECTSIDSNLVLVGHSMGGMTIMALAELMPELFVLDGRVGGVVLISTSAGGVTFGLPDVVVRFRGSLLPLLAGAGTASALMLDRARNAASKDLAWLLTRKFGFGSGTSSPALVCYVERMNAATPTDSVARYVRALYAHDRIAGLSTLKQVPVLVICGDEDQVTPLEHSRILARELPHAQLAVIPGGGHVALLEHPEAVNAGLLSFIRKIVV
jgi:pimeloyl-ACP methyl ester carboxylesterase